MNEVQAREWLAARFSADRIERLGRYVELLRSGAAEQSLIARSTFDSIWARHIVDSAQLLRFVDSDDTWLDVGSGAGLPGIVIAVLRDAPIILCEPRRKRVEFLNHAIDNLGLRNARVFPAKVERLDVRCNVVTARAVSSIDQIFAWSRNAVSRETLFVLQRGRSYQEDVALAGRAWHGAFHVERSLTDPNAAIVLARDVRAI